MFLHSTQWRDFQERVGRTTYSIEDTYAIKMQGSFGNHYLVSYSSGYIEALIECAQKTGALFVKVESMEEGEGGKNKFLGHGFGVSNKHLQPQKTIILDLDDREKVLAKMKQKTRYNIRLAAKKGVEVRQEDKVDNFLKLLSETALRDQFSAHSSDYYKELIKTKGVKVYTSFVGNNFASSAIVIEHDGVGTYLHGASSYKYRSYMTPFALHWHIIKELIQNGIQKYDFWGIDEKKWPGVTKFKIGFGGDIVEYSGSFDYPIKKLWYFVYKIKQKI